MPEKRLKECAVLEFLCHQNQALGQTSLFCNSKKNWISQFVKNKINARENKLICFNKVFSVMNFVQTSPIFFRAAIDVVLALSSKSERESLKKASALF